MRARWIYVKPFSNNIFGPKRVECCDKTAKGVWCGLLEGNQSRTSDGRQDDGGDTTSETAKIEAGRKRSGERGG